MSERFWVRYGMLLCLSGCLFMALPQAFGQMEEVKPMAKGAHPVFEVATIRPAAPNADGGGFHTMGHRLFYENEAMEDLIAFAYSVHRKQIVGAPEWFSGERWDVKGVPDLEGQPNQVQQQEMLQKLLAERFNLKLHSEKRELSMFSVTVAKGGAKLVESKSDPNDLPDETGNNDGAQQMWRFTNCSIADFAMVMQFLLDRPVVDQTGMKGRFDFNLNWTVDGSLNVDPKAPPGFLTAVQEQLGLRIQPEKGPVEVLVIDHVERPSAN